MKALLLLVVCLIAVKCVPITKNGMKIERLIDTPLGPSYMEGELGKIEEMSEEGVRGYIERRLTRIYHLNPSITLSLTRISEDFAGMVHYHYSQEMNGLKVEYSRLIVHINPHSLQVFALSAHLLPGSFHLPSHPALSLSLATSSILSLIPSLDGDLQGDLLLLYLLLDSSPRLAFKADVIYGGGAKRSHFYLDAMKRSLLAEIPLKRELIHRTILDDAAQEVAREEGDPPAPAANVNALYDNLGICYDYFLSVHGRASYDGNDAPLYGYVNFGIDLNNAFWAGELNVLAFGNGDGVMFSDLAEDLIVVCHELAHGVIQYTADLIYKDQSGALNEAFADILGYSASHYEGVDAQYQWMVGYQSFTPAVMGDALRYMNDPTRDGTSNDFYPGYEGTQDYGGVHWNSGIANLAFVLAVEGGTHPQGRSTIQVEAMGYSNAERIFYTVLDNYLTPNSDFAIARAATEVAARVAFGADSPITASASDCWEAVGVPSSSSSSCFLSPRKGARL